MKAAHSEPETEQRHAEGRQAIHDVHGRRRMVGATTDRAEAPTARAGGPGGRAAQSSLCEAAAGRRWAGWPEGTVPGTGETS